jgi:hypothetical protein
MQTADLSTSTEPPREVLYASHARKSLVLHLHFTPCAKHQSYRSRQSDCSSQPACRPFRCAEPTGTIHSHILVLHYILRSVPSLSTLIASVSLSCLFISISLCLLHLSTSTSCHILTNTTLASTTHRSSSPVQTRHRTACSTSSPSGKLCTTAGPPLICSRTSPNPPTCERSLVHEGLGDRQNALGYDLTLDGLYAGGQDLRLYYRLCA